jgi:hypothetical protein
MTDPTTDPVPTPPATEPPPSTPPTKANYDSDDFKKAVGDVLGGMFAEAEKSSPSGDLRATLASLLDEREAKSKSSSETVELTKKVGELEATVKKLGSRVFSIFDGL